MSDIHNKIFHNKNLKSLSKDALYQAWLKLSLSKYVNFCSLFHNHLPLKTFHTKPKTVRGSLDRGQFFLSQNVQFDTYMIYHTLKKNIISFDLTMDSIR